MRQARVRLHHDGPLGDGEHPLRQRGELRRAERAVDADDVRAEGAQGDRCDLGTRAEEGAAIGLEGHRGGDRQIAVLLGRENRRLGLEQIGHGLDHEQVGPGRRRSANLLREKAICLIEGHRAERAEQRAKRADVGRHIPCPGRTSASHGRTENLVQALARPFGRELKPVGSEGVGGDDLGPRLHIRAVNGRDRCGVREAEQLRQGPGLEARGLEHRPHGAVEEQVPATLENRTEVIVDDAQSVEAARGVRGRGGPALGHAGDVVGLDLRHRCSSRWR